MVLFVFNGTKLRELQEVNELNDRLLAERLKLNPTMIWHYRKGNKQPNLHTAKYIAEYFGVPVDDLVVKISLPES